MRERNGRGWLATRAVVLAAMVFPAVAVVGLVACGGGGGCSGGETVYDSYGYGGSSDVEGEIGEPIDLTLAAHVSSGCSLSHKLEGALPAGVKFDSGSGRISGTPTAAGEYPVRVHPNASGVVSTSLTLVIQPIGRQTDEASPAKLPAVVPAARYGASPRIAATVVNGSLRLWLGEYVSSDEHDSPLRHYRLFRSDDEGASWTADDAGGLITVRGDSMYDGQFLLSAVGAEVFVFDSGGTNGVDQVSSRLYRFDGTRWALRNGNLPFVSPPGAGFYVASGGVMGVAFSEEDGMALWTSQDKGLTWHKQTNTSGDYFYYGQDFCLGRTGEEWRIGGGKLQTPAGSVSSAWPWRSYVAFPETCASDGTHQWVMAEHLNAPTDMALSDVIAGEDAMAYPRRMKPAPGAGLPSRFKAIAAADGRLFGMVVLEGAAGYEVWKIR